MLIFILIHIFIFVSVLFCDVFSSNYDLYHINNNPQNCGDSEYYNILSFNCSTCDPSSAGGILELTCTCDERSIIVGWNNGFPKCKRCRDTEVPSVDSRLCLTCKGRHKFVSRKQCFGCDEGSVFVELHHNDTLNGETSCFQCHVGSVPSKDHLLCKWCDPAAPLCSCSQSALTECSTKANWSPSSQIYRLDYGGVQIESAFLRISLPKFANGCKNDEFYDHHELKLKRHFTRRRRAR